MTEKHKAAGKPLTKTQEAMYAEWADRFEDGDLSMLDGARVELSDESKAAAIFDELDTAINRGGRPALDGPAGAGESPVRRFRLTRELDAALTERERTEHRKASAIMRDALAEYLSKAS